MVDMPAHDARLGARLVPGTVLEERYRLEAILGAGSFGVVWQARHQHLETECAVKLFDPPPGADVQDASARFLQEARLMARLKCPHVAQVFDFGVHERMPFLVLELLRGTTLAERLQLLRQEGRRMSPRRTVHILRHVAEALHVAHTARVVHRDLKPENIFLVEEGGQLAAKVLDFGIAKWNAESLPGMTTTRIVMGTPHYMSPEQFESARQVDHRADLWSLGVIAFECLTGTVPFPGETLIDVAFRVLKQGPLVASQLAEVPRGFDRWFARATALAREYRFESAREQVNALAEVCSLPPPQAAARAESPGAGRGVALVPASPVAATPIRAVVPAGAQPPAPPPPQALALPPPPLYSAASPATLPQASPAAPPPAGARQTTSAAPALAPTPAHAVAWVDPALTASDLAVTAVRGARLPFAQDQLARVAAPEIEVDIGELAEFVGPPTPASRATPVAFARVARALHGDLLTSASALAQWLRRRASRAAFLPRLSAVVSALPQRALRSLQAVRGQLRARRSPRALWSAATVVLGLGLWLMVLLAKYEEATVTAGLRPAPEAESEVESEAPLAPSTAPGSAAPVQEPPSPSAPSAHPPPTLPEVPAPVAPAPPAPDLVPDGSAAPHRPENPAGTVPPKAPAPTPAKPRAKEAAAQGKPSPAKRPSSPAVASGSSTPAGSGAAKLVTADPRGAVTTEEPQPAPLEPVMDHPVAAHVMDAIAAALGDAAALAASCRPPGGPSGHGKARVEFGNDGKVRTLEILTGKFRNTVAGSCVSMVLRRAKVEPFLGDPPTFIKSFEIPEP